MANCYGYAINHQTQPPRPAAATMLRRVRSDGLVGNFVLTAEMA
jgi:hypothetical protein